MTPPQRFSPGLRGYRKSDLDPIRWKVFWMVRNKCFIFAKDANKSFIAPVAAGL